MVESIHPLIDEDVEMVNEESVQVEPNANNRCMIETPAFNTKQYSLPNAVEDDYNEIVEEPPNNHNMS